MKRRLLYFIEVALATFIPELALTLLLKVQQAVYHHRAQRLLADFDNIELHTSDWQRLKGSCERGAWGHFNDSCTPQSCHYKILLLNNSELVRGVSERPRSLPYGISATTTFDNELPPSRD